PTKQVVGVDKGDSVSNQPFCDVLYDILGIRRADPACVEIGKQPAAHLWPQLGQPRCNASRSAACTWCCRQRIRNRGRISAHAQTQELLVLVRLVALVAVIVPFVATGTAFADNLPPLSQCYSVAVTGGPEVTVCQP